MKMLKGRTGFCLAVIFLSSLAVIGWMPTEAAAKEAGDLDQVRNGAADDPVDPADWVNGNVGSQTGHFIEGYSIPYRLRLTDLTLGANYVDIEWDIKHSDKHAIDYVTRFDYIDTPPHQNVFDHPAELIDPRALTVPSDAFPIAGPENTMPFPVDPTLPITPIPLADRYMTLWGGVIDSMAYLMYGDLGANQSATRLRIWFHATNDSALFAWGGHIGSRADWGFDPVSGDPNSAGGISGSPYHTRFIELNGSGGNQDRSLSAVAVYVPCGTCDISGDDPVCPGSTHVYTSTITGTCETPVHNWIVTGGTIIGPADGPSITVQFPLSCGTATIKDSTTCTGCTGSPLVCEMIVNVSDDTPPVLSGCPSDATYDCYNLVPSAATVTATDNCAGTLPVTFSENQSNPGSSCDNTITRTWIAVDDCGNADTCIQIITVDDTTPPDISGVGGPATIECPAMPTFSNPSAGDNCDLSPSLTYVDTTFPGGCPQEYSVKRTWTATDDCGNISKASQTITVTDNTAPIISGVGGPATIECPAEPTFSNPSASDACDTDVMLNYVDSTFPGACPQEYSVKRTWTATDDCGNSAKASQTITVQDNTPPMITCPDDVRVNCDAIVDFGTATATDACDPDPDVTYDDDTVSTQCPLTINRLWTATDACGNWDTCTQIITIVDETPPNITGVGGPMTIECPAEPEFSNPSASDNCDPDPSLTYVDSTFPGACPQEYSVKRTWTATDFCENSAKASQTITVTDNTAPIISGVGGPATIECPATPTFSNPSASDACDPEVTLNYVDSTFPGACPQEYSVKRTWSATDDCGNSAKASQTITVTDNTAPIISGVGGPVTIECPAEPEFSNPSASDVCDPEVTLNYVDSTFPGSCPQEYSVKRTWTATDDCGNSAKASQTITVEDTTPPMFTFCAADDTIACADELVFTPPTAEDACDPDPVITDLPTDSMSGPGVGEVTYTKSWVATDACGNVSDTCTQTIIREACEEGCTFTIGGWGSDCPESQSGNMMSTQPGCIRDHYFSTAFPGGEVIVGYPTGYTARWTSAAAIAAYLPPVNGGAKALTRNYVNPTATAKTGILVAQILGLTLNREYSCAGVFYDLGLWTTNACYGDHVIGPECGAKFVGLTVDEFLLLANKVVSGQTNLLQPYGASLSDLNQTATCLNELYDGCDPFAMVYVASASEPEISDENALPSDFSLEQNKPNPFNPSSQISFNLPEAMHVRLEVFNVVGQKVATLVDGQVEAGYHTVTWDASDVVSGIYFYRLETSTFASTKKMVLLK